ncbi:MAG: hypothetical protein QXT68_03655 [Halobacteria archaeon]
MKEFRFDEEGDPVEVVEVDEGQEVRLAPGGGTVHVYIRLKEGLRNLNQRNRVREASGGSRAGSSWLGWR